MNAHTCTSSDQTKVEFVCRDCKEGEHGCPGYWTGLGLQICCSCTCVANAPGSQKENMRHYDDSKQSTANYPLQRDRKKYYRHKSKGERVKK